MKFVILIVGLTLSTIVLLLSVLYQSHWGFMLSVVLQAFPVLLTRDELGARWWYTPGFLAWWGTSLLVARWLQLSDGLQVDAVFDSFGPGYLTMAALALIWPRWFNSARSTNAKGQ